MALCWPSVSELADDHKHDSFWAGRLCVLSSVVLACVCVCHRSWGGSCHLSLAFWWPHSSLFRHPCVLWPQSWWAVSLDWLFPAAWLPGKHLSPLCVSGVGSLYSVVALHGVPHGLLKHDPIEERLSCFSLWTDWKKQKGREECGKGEERRGEGRTKASMQVLCVHPCVSLG